MTENLLIDTQIFVKEKHKANTFAADTDVVWML